MSENKLKQFVWINLDTKCFLAELDNIGPEASEQQMEKRFVCLKCFNLFLQKPSKL